MKTQLLKYWRVSDDKSSLILIPTHIGVEILKGALDTNSFLYREAIEKIDKTSLFAIVVNFGVPIRYLKYEVQGIMVTLYIYLENETKFWITFPFDQ